MGFNLAFKGLNRLREAVSY